MNYLKALSRIRTNGGYPSTFISNILSHSEQAGRVYHHSCKIHSSLLFQVLLFHDSPGTPKNIGKRYQACFPLIYARIPGRLFLILK
jgi:hypothetical protein